MEDKNLNYKQTKYPHLRRVGVLNGKGKLLEYFISTLCPKSEAYILQRYRKHCQCVAMMSGCES
jgi:hypothetical protein